MAKVKNTARRVRSTRLPLARKTHCCPKCAKEYGQKSNLVRHMGVTHKLTANGEKIDDATLAKYLAYNRGAKHSKQPIEPIPSTSDVARTTKMIPDQPAEYPRKVRPDSPVAAKGKKRLTPRVPAKSDAVVGDDPAIRKPTRPAVPVCRRKRFEITKLMPTTTQSIMKASSDTARSKRRMEMAPSTLAKRVAASGHLSSRRLAEDIASRYAMPSLDTRHNENIIRGMRAAERHLTAKIRRMLPLNRTATDISEFLKKLEDECRRTEDHDSDEFV